MIFLKSTMAPSKSFSLMRSIARLSIPAHPVSSPSGSALFSPLTIPFWAPGRRFSLSSPIFRAAPGEEEEERRPPPPPPPSPSGSAPGESIWGGSSGFDCEGAGKRAGALRRDGVFPLAARAHLRRPRRACSGSPVSGPPPAVVPSSPVPFLPPPPPSPPATPHGRRGASGGGV